MSGPTDTWMTPQEQYGGSLCSFFSLEERSIVLDMAATLVTPETPEVFCGLNTPRTPHLQSGE